MSEKKFKSAEEILDEFDAVPLTGFGPNEWTYFYHDIVKAMKQHTAQLQPAQGERFKMPTGDQLVKIAILFNDGGIDQEKLSCMVGMCQFVLDRIHENNDVMIPCSNESTENESEKGGEGE